MRSSLAREWWFLRRDRQAVATIVAAFFLAAVAVGMGLRDVALQEEEITALNESTRTDLQVTLADQPDAGSAAYYAFRLAYDPPSELAFAAKGVRDDLPWKHRVRILALEGQIYETDAANPELGQVGRFDYAFLISVLAPLLVILLMHDVIDGERRGNRLDLLEATAGNAGALFSLRSVLRTAVLGAALLVPFVVAAAWSGGALIDIVLLAAVTLGYLLFWTAVSLWVARRLHAGATTAAALLGVWALTVLAIPLTAAALAERWVDVPEGGEILLAQRETVNRAWDLPKSATMDAFVASHPEWEDFADIPTPFEWQWYYAFQQIGDESVADISAALRDGVRQRDRVMQRASLISPPLFVDRFFTRRARTDIRAFQAYDACVRDFHESLRKAHYPMLFGVETYDAKALLELESSRNCARDLS